MTDRDPLAIFQPATRAWFGSAFAAPTAVQRAAWSTISAGRHSLIVAPTGSGKTLAAFLWSLDRLSAEANSRHCRVLYVSPLKALAVDIERNLRTPLAGITRTAALLGHPPPRVTVALRTGDTPTAQRRSFAKNPSDILITTPESLFLILTSAARSALRGVQTVIVDEVHALCATKRGAHLALSLERLDALLERPAQRIGLSATVRPVDEAASFLGGAAPVEIVAPPATRGIEVSVQVPVADMTTPADAGSDNDDEPRSSIWPAVEQRVYDLVTAHRSTIVFTNSRRSAERLCARLNEIAAGPPATADTRQGLATPAMVMGQAGEARGTPALLARAHHGSVSRQERQQIEQALKSGRLKAVVATSSLELGIDMGAVDLVVQIGSPPTVAAGIQRVGRSGHRVGAVSRGVLLPQHRADLVSCAVVANRVQAGDIENLRYPRNPLDVLAQQIVAAVAMEPWRVDDLAALARRAGPFAGLPDSALTAVLDMLTGRYPSTEFAALRPRLVWDRTADVLTARPGAQHLAVTSGGTIPDRGLFGVFLAASGDTEPRSDDSERSRTRSGQTPTSGSHAGGARGGRSFRVGELDEEMVYESRVGDVFLLGSTSWRITDITPDRVLVTPAPGAPARMPFWKGESPGRPAELGLAVGRQVRTLMQATLGAARGRLAADGLDTWAVDNLLGYLWDQRTATGSVPDDRTIVVERFRDELGDWRLTVHCLLGARVNGPWALAIAARISQRYGVDGRVLPSDDGIVIRLPDHVDVPPGAELVSFAPEEIASVVEQAVGTSAAFAARFRECAARALLLSRPSPGRRQPLWQQRQRAAQLLDVARRYPDFPITLEAARECLQDLYDLPGLTTVMGDLASRRMRLVEVETSQPSPFARALLFGYVGAFLYEEDSPLAERKAAALALDPVLLRELLGVVELRELLDPAVVADTGRRLQRLTGEHLPRDAEDAAELLRTLGDLSDAEVTARGVDPVWMAALAAAGRAIRVRIAGEDRWLAVEDAARVRDALGVRLPPGVAAAHTEPVDDPLGDLVARYAARHGPFPATALAARFGLGTAVVDPVLRAMAARGRIVAGAFSPVTEPTGGAEGEWCDAQVLRLLRQRSLAALRREIEPVTPAALTRFLPAWQQLGDTRGRGVDALLAAVEQLHGVAVPASALESLILPARVADYSPGYLDRLCAAGEVMWAGCGALPGQDGWITLACADAAPLQLTPPDPDAIGSPLHRAVLDALENGQALFFRALADRTRDLLDAPVAAADLAAALWELVWAGWISGDTPAPLRARLNDGAGHSPRAVPRRARRAGRSGFPIGWAGRPADSPMGSSVGSGGGRGSTPGGLGVGVVAFGGTDPSVAGRWYRLPERETDPTRRAWAAAEALLERHGVVTRPAVLAERVPGGFAGVYPVFTALEERRAIRRGYFVEGLGAAQFALPGAVDRLRAIDRDGTPADGPWSDADTLVLASTDPACAYGAALAWPEPATGTGTGTGKTAPGIFRGCSSAPAPAAGTATRPDTATVAETGVGAETDPDIETAPGAGHRPGRRPGAVVVLLAGQLVLFVERGGRSILAYDDRQPVVTKAAQALAAAVHAGALGPLSVERINGGPVHVSLLREAFLAAGFRVTPRGLRLRG